MTDFQQRLQLQFPSPAKLFTPAVTTFLVLMIIGYAIANYFLDFTLQYLVLSPSSLLQGKVWQLVTYSFINVCSCNLVFNGLTLLFIGSAVEREWKTRMFILLWFVVTVVCGLVWVLVNFLFGWNYAGIGTGAFVYGIIAAFGLLFRGQKILFFFWTTEAQFIAWLIIGIGLIVGIARPISWVWVGGALVAYVYIQIRWKMEKRRLESFSSQSSFRSGGFVDLE